MVQKMLFQVFVDLSVEPLEIEIDFFINPRTSLSISSEEPHFNKIEESVRSYITNYNSKNSEGLSMLFTDDAIQNVNSKEGIVLGREQIKLTENYSDGGELNAII